MSPRFGFFCGLGGWGAAIRPLRPLTCHPESGSNVVLVGRSAAKSRERQLRYLAKANCRPKTEV